MAKPRPNRFERMGFVKLTPEQIAALDAELAVPFEDGEPDELTDVTDLIAECIAGVVADCIDANDPDMQESQDD